MLVFLLGVLLMGVHGIKHTMLQDRADRTLEKPLAAEQATTSEPDSAHLREDPLLTSAAAAGAEREAVREKKVRLWPQEAGAGAGAAARDHKNRVQFLDTESSRPSEVIADRSRNDVLVLEPGAIPLSQAKADLDAMDTVGSKSWSIGIEVAIWGQK